MNVLTKDQIEYISKKINNSNIKSTEMKEDLIDHFCCAIEEYMQMGLCFDESYNRAYCSICPDGFAEIQREMVFLLTFRKIKVMKRLMYVSGYLSVVGITSTVFMKLAHITGGQLVLLATAIILAFIFLPTLFVYLYKRELIKSLGNKIKYMSGLIGIVLVIALLVFKIAHWPGTTLIFLASIIILNFIFFPFLFFKIYKRSVE